MSTDDTPAHTTTSAGAAATPVIYVGFIRDLIRIIEQFFSKCKRLRYIPLIQEILWFKSFFSEIAVSSLSMNERTQLGKVEPCLRDIMDYCGTVVHTYFWTSTRSTLKRFAHMLMYMRNHLLLAMYMHITEELKQAEYNDRLRRADIVRLSDELTRLKKENKDEIVST